ncbi:MAG: hypothetical protein K2H01_00910, partial [Ruminococcus sp.]|nr:hypothetical protein [Ruminococcus sp.]
VWRTLKFHYLKRFGSPKKYAEILYKIKFGKRINWKEPEDLNQWINWLSFYSDTSQWPLLADKYRVREFIMKKGFGDNLIPLLGVWEDPSDLSFDNLPEKFILKANNGSGDVLIVKDKTKENIEDIRAHFKGVLNAQFGKLTAEPHYLKIKPCIIAEEVLDLTQQEQESESLIDYKFWCFNGKPVCCFICSNRTPKNFTIDLYSADKDWRRIDEGNLIFDSHHLKAAIPMPRPEKLDEMLRMVSELSKGIPQARIDLYQVNNKIYFGEITLTSFAGRMEYFSKDFLKELGNYCKKALKEIEK